MDVGGLVHSGCERSHRTCSQENIGRIPRVGRRQAQLSTSKGCLSRDPRGGCWVGKDVGEVRGVCVRLERERSQNLNDH